jgi:hypothetical protein
VYLGAHTGKNETGERTRTDAPELKDRDAVERLNSGIAKNHL